MKKYLLIVFLLLLCLACESKQKDNAITVNQNEESKEAVNIYDVPLDKAFEDEAIIYEPKESDIYTFDRLKQEFKETFDNFLLPVGIYFWDEFEDLETQYGLTEDESKLLGQWLNVTYSMDNNNYYYFYPNKLFLIKFKSGNYHISGNLYLYHAVGTWDIVSGIVRFTVYAFILQEASGNYLPYSKESKSVFFVWRPYTVDFINIDDIGEEGFTKWPINDTVFSNDLQGMVRIKEPNMSNNLYVRTVYSIHWITNSGKPEKAYRYFDIVREMAQENLSGLDIVTNRELIEKYIFNLWL
ncbi:MAG: hypothetical protein LBQ93_10650 [Treponema sp.]|jgi:hypothetical protein|nr:hypothetical protein [Treponema sp.]